jgi:hypothetical protein
MSPTLRPGHDVSGPQFGSVLITELAGATKVVIRRLSTPCRGGEACTRATFRSHCLEGERATGGGARVTSEGDRLVASEPLAYGDEFDPSTPTAWEATVEDGGGGGGISAEVSVVCVSP